jgi:hypothetical protein
MKTQTHEMEAMSPIVALSLPSYDLPKLPPVLTPKEFDRLEDLELEFKGLQKGFERAGEILLEIRDKQLYRQEYKTFEEYCRTRWNMGARRGRQLADSANVLKNIAEQTGTMVPLPKNERQVRALTALPAREQGEVWEEVTKKATEENRAVTGKDVERAVQERKQPGFKLETELQSPKSKVGKFSEVQIDAWVDIARNWFRPGDEVSIAVMMGERRNSFDTYQVAAIFDEMVERGMVKNRRYVEVLSYGTETAKLAEKVYKIASEAAQLKRKWREQSIDSQRFVCEVVKWHMKELQRVLDEREREAHRELLAKRTAQNEFCDEVEKQIGTPQKATKGTKAWPKPNKHGVYDEKDAEIIVHSTQALRASIALLQIDAKRWTFANHWSTRSSGGNGSPLTAKTIFPDRASALKAAACKLRDEMIGESRSTSGCMTSAAKAAAKKCAKWAASLLTRE